MSGLTVAVALEILGLSLAANAPFFSARILLCGPFKPQRGVGWRLLELLILGAVVVIAGMGWEAHLGQRHPQGWEFYAVIVCLLLTLGFPGFVWRYLKHR
jgi:hypothetical protein